MEEKDKELFDGLVERIESIQDTTMQLKGIKKELKRIADCLETSLLKEVEE